MPAQTIDEVVVQLDDIIERARRQKSRLGYFAVLYRNVTVKVKEGIAAGSFEDGGRMERLDVAFANRYLEAEAQYRRGERPSLCWLASFEASHKWYPLVLQHLLLGMNAHINLDLGVAAALTSPGDKLAASQRDFDQINNILCAMMDDVQNRLARVSRWMTLLDRAGCRTDEAVMEFSINKARELAWRAAVKLAPLSPADTKPVLDKLDRNAARLARLILIPGFTPTLANLAVRLSEPSDVAEIIDILN
jgi:hypothetical protein